jgi:hypothetical protein
VFEGRQFWLDDLGPLALRFVLGQSRRPLPTPTFPAHESIAYETIEELDRTRVPGQLLYQACPIFARKPPECLEPAKQAPESVLRQRSQRHQEVKIVIVLIAA